MQRVEVRIDDFTRVEAQIARITRDHALGVTARGHGGEVLRLEVLDDLRADLDDVGDLLDRDAELAPALEQHIAEVAAHLHPSKNLIFGQRLLDRPESGEALLVV